MDKRYYICPVCGFVSEVGHLDEGEAPLCVNETSHAPFVFPSPFILAAVMVPVGRGGFETEAAYQDEANKP